MIISTRYLWSIVSLSLFDIWLKQNRSLGTFSNVTFLFGETVDVCSVLFIYYPLVVTHLLFHFCGLPSCHYLKEWKRMKFRPSNQLATSGSMCSVRKTRNGSLFCTRLVHLRVWRSCAVTGLSVATAHTVASTMDLYWLCKRRSDGTVVENTVASRVAGRGPAVAFLSLGQDYRWDLRISHGLIKVKERTEIQERYVFLISGVDKYKLSIPFRPISRQIVFYS